MTAPVYVARAEALAYVRALLDSAAATIAATPPSAFFNANILTPGVNLTNVIQLFRARYARMANDDATALAAANLVARTGTGALSVLTFPSPGVNFYANVTGGTNGIAPRRQWRLSMAAGDQRFTYFVTPSTTVTGRIGALLDPWSRYANPQAPLPVYFPDEALLIKAEALANQNQLAASQAALDSVRTDCTGGRGTRRSEGVSHGADRAAVSEPSSSQRSMCSGGTSCSAPDFAGKTLVVVRPFVDRPRRPPFPPTDSAAGCRTRSAIETPTPMQRSPRFPIPRSRLHFPQAAPRSEADEHDEESPNYLRARRWRRRRRRAERRTRRAHSRPLARRDASDS